MRPLMRCDDFENPQRRPKVFPRGTLGYAQHLKIIKNNKIMLRKDNYEKYSQYCGFCWHIHSIHILSVRFRSVTHKMELASDYCKTKQ